MMEFTASAIKDAKWDMMVRQEAGKTDHLVFLDICQTLQTHPPKRQQARIIQPDLYTKV